MSAPRAIIIGAGIAGLSSAIALRNAGWRVKIFEQASALVPMGAALSLWPNAMTALDWLGCGDALRSRAAPLTGLLLAEKNGRAIMRNSIDAILPGKTAYLPSRTLLQETLLRGATGITIHLGHQLHGYVEGADKVSVRFRNGTEEAADILIAADGIRSAIAKQVNGDLPRHAGYGGVLALSEPVSQGHFDGVGAEYWSNGERIGLFDLGDSRRYWFYMRNEKAASEAAAVTLDLVRKRVGHWSQDIGAALDATPREKLIPFSIHAKPPPRLLGRGRIALVGDAAHAMEPNLGQGACQALEDAVALGIAGANADPVDVAARYNLLRLKRARKFVSMSQQGAIIPHKLPGPVASASQLLMGPLFRALAPRQMRTLFQMPDYAAMLG